jgi:hypothetical protein
VFVEEVDEDLDASVGREVYSGFGFVILEAGVRAVFEEDATDGGVAFDGGEHEECPTVLVGEVGVKAGVQGCAEGGFVATFDQVLCGAIGHMVMLPVRSRALRDICHLFRATPLCIIVPCQFLLWS